MKFEGWYLLLGALLLAVTLLDRVFKRLPVTTTMIYLALGIALGPVGLGLVHLDPLANSALLERVTELAVIVSLFTAGLKLRARFGDARWKVPVRLAFVSMALTVALIAAFAWFFLQLPIGAAVLLGAILAPTDPVLASDVQLEHPGDRDRLRFSLTGEAGLNDGTAFPFVMLGLGLLGLHELGAGGWRWVAVDLAWAAIGGLGIGTLLGTAVGRLVVWLRKKHEETASRDEFISLGLIGCAYGTALLCHAYGFLAVFASGLALRHIELGAAAPAERSDTPAKMTQAVLEANEQFERMLEVAAVLLVGAMLSMRFVTWGALWMIVALFAIVRPAAVWMGTRKSTVTPLQKTLLAWFGIRGIGSLYYLMYALRQGVPERIAEKLAGLVLCVVVASIFVHGFSVTPIMNYYERRKQGRAVSD